MDFLAHVCSFLFSMCFEKNILWLISVIIVFEEISAGDDDYNILNTDGSYDFGYNNPDNYHYAQANRNNVVRGEFGGRNPKTGAIDTTHYTAGPRGYRPRGKNIVRKYDLSQNGPRAIGSPDDPYYDPYEDPSYSFSFRTRTYNRDENANRVGDVNGRYSYIDDVGERHNVEFIAGKKTGFHVKTPFPDSNPRAYGPLYFRGRGRPIPRGRTSIQRGLDGSYKFVSAGPDQRRTETSDATGHVRGSYTYLDDKGVQHSVHYIAGPETGYRVLKNVKGPHLPTIFPFQHPDIIPPDFYDTDPEIFNTAASGRGHVKPNNKPGFKDEDNGIDGEDEDFGSKAKPRPPIPSSTRHPYGDDTFGSKKPTQSPYDNDDSGDDLGLDDLFGGGASKGGGRGKGEPGTTSRPSKPPSSFGKPSSEEDSFETSKEGSSSSSKQDGLYKPPKNGLYIPPISSKPSGRPGGSSEEDYGFGNKPPAGPSTFKSPVGGGGSEEDFGGLFGSESKRPRPPVRQGGGDDGGGPLITIGGSNKDCPKCQGTLVTNVGDTYLSVAPGVSVRAHVQAIDLLPYSSRFPAPSEQYKADINIKTEQLNAENDKIVGKKDENDIGLQTEQLNADKDIIVDRKDDKNKDVDQDEDDGDESSTTEETTTEIVPTTFSPKNSKKIV